MLVAYFRTTRIASSVGTAQAKCPAIPAFSFSHSGDRYSAGDTGTDGFRWNADGIARKNSKYGLRSPMINFLPERYHGRVSTSLSCREDYLIDTLEVAFFAAINAFMR